MNKRLIASVSCAVLLLSSTGLAAEARLSSNFKAVDVVTAATTAPAAPAPKPAAKPAKTPAVQASKSQATSATSSNIARLIALNSVGEDVKLLQTMLNNSGYVLNVDGVVGNKTLNAIKDFQGKNGLRVDGIVGPKTLAKLTPIVAEAEVVKPEVIKSAEVVEPAEIVEPAEVVEPVEKEEVDVVSSASIVTDIDGFEKAIAEDGTWIICLEDNITAEKELVLTGDLKNGKKNDDGTDAIQRKIALYTQDDDKKIIDEFTLTVSKLTINSANARIQNGTFKGDLYVSVPDFKLVGTKVDGNIYFTNQEAMDTFDSDEKSSVTGVQELKAEKVEEVDVVTSASIVDNAAAFEKAISKEGAWIAGALNDITFEKEIVLEGEFTNKDLPARKIALYTQDENRVTTAKFTLTAPKLTIKSPEASIQKGTFKGDLYVTTPNFKLVDAIIEGNVYFTTQEAMDTFALDETSSVTGVQELKVN